MVEIRLPQDRFVERYGDYEIWIGHKLLPQVIEGRERTPSQNRRTMVVYSVRRRGRDGTYTILSDNHVTKSLATGSIKDLTTFERL